MPEQSLMWKIGSFVRLDSILLKNSSLEAELDLRELGRVSPALDLLFSQPIIVTASPDWNAISIFAEAWWDQLLPKLWRLPKESPEVRRFMRYTVGCAFRLSGEESLVLPKSLVSHGKLWGDCVLLHFSDKHAEIWSECQLSRLSAVP